MATKGEWEVINREAEKLFLMPEKKRIEWIYGVLDQAKDLRDKVVVSFFYIYGLRPEELLQLKKDDFSIRETEVMVKLPTAKGGHNRFILLSKKTPCMEYILKWLELTPIADWLIFKEFSDPTNFNLACGRIAKNYEAIHGKKIYLSPYIFRKFRIAWIQEQPGVTNNDVLAWKGGKSLRVIEQSYHFAKPVTKFKDVVR